MSLLYDIGPFEILRLACLVIHLRVVHYWVSNYHGSNRDTICKYITIILHTILSTLIFVTDFLLYFILFAKHLMFLTKLNDNTKRLGLIIHHVSVNSFTNLAKTTLSNFRLYEISVLY